MKAEASGPGKRPWASRFCRAGVQRDAIPLGRLRAASPIRLRADALAQWYDARVISYWVFPVAKTQGSHASLLSFQLLEVTRKNENDKAQRPGRKAWCLQSQAQWPSVWSHQRWPHRCCQGKTEHLLGLLPGVPNRHGWRPGSWQFRGCGTTVLLPLL